MLLCLSSTLQTRTGVAKYGLDVKAAAILGEAYLEKRALSQVSDTAQLNPKVIDMMGDRAVAPTHARKRLGSEMTPMARYELK